MGIVGAAGDGIEWVGTAVLGGSALTSALIGLPLLRPSARAWYAAQPASPPARDLAAAERR